MINMVVADGKNEELLIAQLKERSGEVDKKVTVAVTEILENVKLNGDQAVKEYTIKFDGKAPEKAEISKEEIEASIAECDAFFVKALEDAAENIRDFHERQLQQSWLTPKENGVIMGQRIRGLERVGIYVPGGTAAYPSSVLMNAIPAKIAGVKEIIMVTPPAKNGKPNPDILAAAKIAGVDRVFLMGGAQAVAALAYGTETVPKVDKIVGPGNIFVATLWRDFAEDCGAVIQYEGGVALFAATLDIASGLLSILLHPHPHEWSCGQDGLGEWREYLD